MLFITCFATTLNGRYIQYGNNLYTNVDDIDVTRELLLEEKRTKSDLENEKNSINSKLVHELGHNDEWAKAVEDCTSKTIDGKNYEFCFFGAVKQDGILLGRFSEWTFKKNPKTDFNMEDFNDLNKLDEADVYGNMKYEYGTRCWNGNDRFVDVVVKCGDKFEILSMIEPSMCTYTMEVSNPAACPDPEGVQTVGKVEENDEL